MNWWHDAPRPPSVAERRAKAARAAAKLRKKMAIAPVVINGRTIARSFWGRAWCANLESYRDFEYRLPRGRSYVRHGAVLDLKIEPGVIEARVSGKRLYTVAVRIRRLPARRWSSLRKRCAGEIGSLIELLQGRLSDSVMRHVTALDEGLFPAPAEIEMDCSCPDWAVMCKHVAATLYGVGARLDESPELLFVLRQVDHLELVDAAADMESVTATRGERAVLDGATLQDVFGIELEEEDVPVKRKSPSTPRKNASKPRKSAKTGAGRKANSRPPKSAESGAARSARKQPMAGKKATVRAARKGESPTRRRKTRSSKAAAKTVLPGRSSGARKPRPRGGS